MQFRSNTKAFPSLKITYSTSISVFSCNIKFFRLEQKKRGIKKNIREALKLNLKIKILKNEINKNNY